MFRDGSKDFLHSSSRCDIQNYDKQQMQTGNDRKHSRREHEEAEAKCIRRSHGCLEDIVRRFPGLSLVLVIVLSSEIKAIPNLALAPKWSWRIMYLEMTQ